jgi:hypothetical protein
VDVCIIYHHTFDVLEVVAFEPTIAVESSPIFVDHTHLALMINENEVQERTRALKEPFLRRKEVPDAAKLFVQARNEAKAELVMNRLQIKNYCVESKVLQMTLVDTFCDVEKRRPKLMCAKPPGLRTYVWTHSNTYT